MASTSTSAAAAPAVAMPSIDDAWKMAQKVRVAVQKELEQIQKDGPGTNEIARFEKVEKLIANYRLACMETIWLDIRAANEKDAENVLWQTQTLVTKTYRKVLSKLQGNDHVVLRRKLEKLYSAYLKTAQFFYRGYLQRVSARYDIKDLNRIARRADLEEMPVPDKDKVDAVATQIDEIVRESCHKTLIYLGDLARYRTLLRSKDRKWDSALTYYFLANELIPESGYGHHQCGVIYVETEDHLQVVYHLYRALTCAVPHPNAATNLEREFRELQRRKGIASKHALATWFVKLHAFYSQGKDFTERKELESEVDHRLAVALKIGTGYGSDTDLLKIVLINITAYVAAQDRIKKNWTDEGSRACQFILLLNVRTIHAIARLLGEEITDIIKRKNAETSIGTAGPSSQVETATKFTSAFNRILTLLRVYMTWLCSYGPELVEFRPHLEPQFGSMATTLSNTLTLLFELLGSDQQIGNPVSWRFPEDEITEGIKCLNGPDLNDGCQLSYDALTRKPKPRREDVSHANHSADDITFTRALDVLLCALDLAAPESKFPLTTSTVTKGFKELTTFVFLEGGKLELTPSVPAVQHPAPPVTGPSTLGQTTKMPMSAVAPSPCESNELSEDREFYGPELRHAARNGIHNGQAAAPAPAPAQAAPLSEFPIDKQIFNILNDFINPPESAPVAKPETPTRAAARISPYGMGSAAVAEAFGAGASPSPAPGSAGSKTFPTLPWEYFYTPAPAGSTLPNSNSNGTGAGWGANGTASSRPTSFGNAAQLGIRASMGNSAVHQTHQRYGSFGHARLVEYQAEALGSLHLGAGAVGQAQQGSSTRGAWPNSAAQGSPSARGLSYNAPQQNPWAPSASPWQTTYGQNQPATTSGASNSPFSTLNFSANTSSLPQVNSPWGLSSTAQRFSATQSPSSPNQLGSFAGVSAPSPSASKYASDYTAAIAGRQTSPVFAPAWPDARQPRTGSSQQMYGGAADIWGNAVLQQQPAVGEKAGGKSVLQGMPKR